jgi:hypothetical protein
MTDDMNQRIRAKARRRSARDPIAENDARVADLERQVAEAKVAKDVADGALEGLARIRHGLDPIPDFGAGVRMTPSRPQNPDKQMDELIRAKWRGHE